MVKAHRFVTVSTVLILLLLSTGQSFLLAADTSAGSSASIHQDSFTCIQEPNVQPPPFEMAPKAVSSKGGSGNVGTIQPPAFKPLCPEGSVPMPNAYMSQKKGNPLIKDGKIQSFDDMYGQNNGQGGQQEPPILYGDPPACAGTFWFGSCYYYASASVWRTADGGGMTTAVRNPMYVAGIGGGHTLEEIAIQSGPGNGHIVELGWNVSSDQYGDSNPHLFVYHWINWAGTCYDGCGWQQYSRTYVPGMDLSAIIGRPVYIGYVYYGGNWWAWFDNQWLGYFPGSIWSGAFTTSTEIQWFGEVSTMNGIPPRTDMGNGLFPAAGSAASMSTLCDVNAADWVCWYRDEQAYFVSASMFYDMLHTGFGQVRYGGPGE